MYTYVVYINKRAIFRGHERVYMYIYIYIVYIRRRQIREAVFIVFTRRRVDQRVRIYSGRIRRKP